MSLSQVTGIVADNPRKVRGERCERLIYEEGGSFPNSVKAWIQGTALVELGGKKVGIKVIGGTGGDSGPQLEGLSHIFNNPLGYNVLPYKNKHTRDGRIQYTGWFMPAYSFSLDSKYIDERGVTDEKQFREYYEKTRQNLEGKDLITYCAEHCFCPEEALLMQGDNIFDAAVISDRLVQIRVHKQYNKPVPTTLMLKDGVIRSIENPNSKLLVVEPPILDEETGQPYKNLYVAGIDAIDMGSQASAQDTDVSDFCIVIKKRMHGTSEPKYVAMYKDRPRDIREAYEIALRLCLWYNCQALLEYTKITIQQYFINKGYGHLFMTRPDFAISQKARAGRSQKRLIGLPATEAVIRHGLDLVGQYISDYVHQIDFDEMLEQMLNYSYENKKKFDIIASLQMVEIADEELTGVIPKSVQPISKQWVDIGYYTDENGIKRKGAIRQTPFTTRWKI